MTQADAHVVRSTPVLAWAAAGLAVALGWAFLASLTHLTLDGVSYWHTADDHMITQRVAMVFHETGRPYYNPGEPVAAATSLVWPMVLSLVYAVADPAGAVVLTIALSAALSLATALLAARLVADPLARIATALLILLSPTFLRYGLSGWEHIPQALAVTAGSVLVWRASGRAGRLDVPTPALLIVALAFLLRADTAPTIAAFALGWLFTGARWRRSSSWALLGALLAIPAAYFLLTRHYFGDPVPNTAHLKFLEADLRLRLGLEYLISPHKSGAVPLLAVLLLLLRPRRPATRFILASAALHLAAILAIGGDVFPFGRFALIYLPILAALALREIEDRLPARQWTAALPLAVLVAWHAPFALSTDLRDQVRFGSQPAHVEQIRVVHRLTRSLDPADGSIGLHFLGIGYHAPAFHVVDFLGKAEPHIARTAARNLVLGHNKWDYPYAFSAYRIAAVPAPAVYGGAPVQPDFPDFWADMAAEIARRGGFVFVPPESFGNPADGYGAFVREDLAPRIVN